MPAATVLRWSIVILVGCIIGVTWFLLSKPAPNRPAEMQAAPTVVGAPLPAIAPAQLVPVAAEEAARINSLTPDAIDVGPPARPFVIPIDTEQGRRALNCLTDAIYYESVSEPSDGQRAVAQVILNRVKSPAFPASVCGVVYQGAERSTGCQFTFTCDGSLRRARSAAAWRGAERIARAALRGATFAPVGHATHYHTFQVLPYWAASLTRVTRIGAHIFYRWSSPWGNPEAFYQRYRRIEPDMTAFIAQWADTPSGDAVNATGLLPGVGALPVLAAPPASALNDNHLAATSRLKTDGEAGELIGSGTIVPRLKADEEAGRLKTAGSTLRR